MSTADKGVVGRVESSADDARDVKEVSTDVVTVVGSSGSGRFASTKDGCTSSEFSSTSELAISRWGSSTGTPVDCGAGFFLRVVTLLGGNEPSVKEYQGSCRESATFYRENDIVEHEKNVNLRVDSKAFAGKGGEVGSEEPDEGWMYSSDWWRE